MKNIRRKDLHLNMDCRR